MKILSDQQVKNVKEIFGGQGDVITKPGREICRDDLEGVDVLLDGRHDGAEAGKAFHGDPIGVGTGDPACSCGESGGKPDCCEQPPVCLQRGRQKRRPVALT